MGISISISGSLKQESKPFNDFFKRIFDFVVALMALVVLSPIFGLIALAIKRETNGPVFYQGLRTGRDGKCFKILKFRTMYETPESYAGPRVTAQDDNRITPLGHWLRDTKLNEFPQFWNVLKGDMSLVGPRPEDPTLAKEWPTEVAQELLSVRPGITSPSSVMYRDEESMLCSTNLIQKYLCDLSPTKIRLDQLYVRYRSFLLDLDTILWTVIMLIPLIRAYSPPEQLLIVGPLTRLIKRYVGWYICDSLVLLFSIWMAEIVLRDIAPLSLKPSVIFEIAVAYLMLYIVAAAKTGANLTRWEKATPRDAVRLSMAWFIATAAVVVGIHFLLGFTSELERILLPIASVFFLVGILLARYRSRVVTGFFRRIRQRQANSKVTAENILIVGSGRTAEHILWLLGHPAYSSKYRVVGIIDDDLFSHGMNIYGVKVLGETKDVAGIIAERRVGLVILADHHMAASNYRSFRETVQNMRARVVVAPDIFGSMERLNTFAPGDVAAGELDNFQCRHCLARSRFGAETQTGQV